MTTHNDQELEQIMQVFISSPTKEMKTYRERAIQAIHDLGMKHVAFAENVPFTHGRKTIFDQNRETVMASDVFIGLYGFDDVWRPAIEQSLCEKHPELLNNPEKMIMEYEYEWARNANLYIFPFLRTYDTQEVPAMELKEGMDRFRRQELRGVTVGWLTTSDAFYDQLVEGLRTIRPRVFLSYSRKNADYVSKLQQELRYEDVHAWRDEANIPGGSKWEAVINAAISQMEAIVVVVTPESLASEWVEKESKAFIEQHKTIIPFIAHSSCRDSLPKYLEDFQSINGTKESGLQDLAKQLRIALGI